MIRCSELRKTYTIGGRSVEALRGLSLEIPGPGFFGVMGQSGSGKSTLLHLLASLDAPDSGELWVGGRAVHAMDEAAATRYRRETIGIVFQQFNLIPTLTAMQNVALPGMLAGAGREWLEPRARELLVQLGLGDRGHHRPEALSGGEQQRVAIARSLLYEPPVLLADEPTGALDSQNSEKLWTLLGEVARERKMTVLMVTHEPAAAAHCQRVFVIHDGVVSGQIDTEGLDAAGVAARYQQCVRAA